VGSNEYKRTQVDVWDKCAGKQFNSKGSNSSRRYSGDNETIKKNPLVKLSHYYQDKAIMCVENKFSHDFGSFKQRLNELIVL